MDKIKLVFIIVALVCFILAAFNVPVPHIGLVGLGLAFWVATLLIK